MVRLVMILLGVDYLRTRWRSLRLMGCASLLLGIVVFIDALDGALYFPIAPFAFLLLLEGLATLAVAWTGMGGQRTLRYAKGIAFSCAAALILAGHHHGHFALSMIFGTLFLADGLLQIVSANLVRYRTWRLATIGGGVEIALAIFFYQPYPTHYAGTVPYCLGLGLILGGWIVERETGRPRHRRGALAQLRRNPQLRRREHAKKRTPAADMSPHARRSAFDRGFERARHAARTVAICQVVSGVLPICVPETAQAGRIVVTYAHLDRRRAPRPRFSRIVGLKQSRNIVLPRSAQEPREVIRRAVDLHRRIKTDVDAIGRFERGMAGRDRAVTVHRRNVTIDDRLAPRLAPGRSNRRPYVHSERSLTDGGRPAPFERGRLERSCARAQHARRSASVRLGKDGSSGCARRRTRVLSNNRFRVESRGGFAVCAILLRVRAGSFGPVSNGATKWTIDSALTGLHPAVPEFSLRIACCEPVLPGRRFTC
ncbi:hypothetical protein [Paraburkholderia strydomiana]|uniref:hypothetical protein n=1 Tax=Paraburkholderia strydomiana TaxID=1245417 RepID=UPI002034EFD6|nr:hypothetical protein [Paraburkholderia strydomiana]